MKALALLVVCVVVIGGLAATSLGADSHSAINIEILRETIDRLGLEYTVEENWVTRLTPEERSRLCGAIIPDTPEDFIMWETRPTGGVTQIDWRDIAGQSFVSGIRDQGPCGSCWAFGALATMESAKMIALDQPDTDPDFSEQNVMTCNWAGHGCSGGDNGVALEMARLAGVPPEGCNPYEATDQLACRTSCPETYDLVEKIAAWGVVSGDVVDIDAINAALEYGPVSTTFQIYESFYAYAGGIYSAVGSVPTDGWHCVAIVGFNDTEGYWIAKNSWSEDWGEDGYFRISYNGGCRFGKYTLACAYATTWDEAVWLVPPSPVAGDPVTVFYDPAGRWLDGTPTSIIHRGHNGWTGVTEDPMVWNHGEEAWEVTFTVPADAHNIQFVFNNGTDTWDNNGGADWSLPVESPGGVFVMDGYLDPSVPLLANEGGPGLYGSWAGGTLYLATLSVGSTPGVDHFLMVVDDTSGTVPAVWGKAGNTVPWAYFLGNENSNGWAGWFDAGEAFHEGPEYARANTGPYLEGTLDIDVLYGGIPPAKLWVAAVAYDNYDGGVLMYQSPAGNGNGNLEGFELYPLELPSAAPAGITSESGEWQLTAEPNPFSSRVAVELSLASSEPVRVAVYDVVGRKIATLHDGLAGPGPMSVHWDGRDLRGAPCASGIYFLCATGRTKSLISKATLLR
ncbi:C1 family peptidase [Candidatus Eisenbacteria bacterium]|uniref:C1 family peptidase n=1 Tax=Eiseniibacteriota bacterium TaxID=2212470 RepID=A0ABV6YNX2_UNCEI